MHVNIVRLLQWIILYQYDQSINNIKNIVQFKPNL